MIHSVQLKSFTDTTANAFQKKSESIFEFHPSEFLIAFTSKNYPLEIVDLHSMKIIDSEEKNFSSNESHLSFLSEDLNTKIISVTADGIKHQNCDSGKLSSFQSICKKWGDSIGDVRADNSGSVMIASYDKSILNLWSAAT